MFSNHSMPFLDGINCTGPNSSDECPNEFPPAIVGTVVGGIVAVFLIAAGRSVYKCFANQSTSTKANEGLEMSVHNGESEKPLMEAEAANQP
ncbi:MAG: hypothetical protein K0S29_840 [Gammaproteobacteria bacterium]|jgi:hypothetical protein|nr:hypothetical protein [Gammaproteobacteria bacterium]